MQSLPGADYPSYFFDVPNANNRADVGDDLLIMYPAKKIKLMAPEEGTALTTEQSPEKEGDKSTENESKMDVDTEPDKISVQESENNVNRASQDSEQVPEEKGADKRAGIFPGKEASAETAHVPDDEPVKETDRKPETKADIVLGQELGEKPRQDLRQGDENQIEKDSKDGPAEERGSVPEKKGEEEMESGDVVEEIELGKDSDQNPKLVHDNDVENVAEKEIEKAPDVVMDVEGEEKPLEPKQVSDVGLEEENDVGEELEEVEEIPESEIYSSYDYIAAVKAAAEYNANLAVDRAALQSWLLEDQRIGEENEGSKDDEDNASSSSG